jgi:lysozyme
MTPHGLALLKAWEGGRLTAYQDGGGIWTIGYGHVGPDVHERLTLSQSQADSSAREGRGQGRGAVDRLVDVPLTAGQHDALTCFVFNWGQGVRGLDPPATAERRRLCDAVPGQLRRWTHDGGHEVPGLVNRREAEIALWSES